MIHKLTAQLRLLLTLLETTLENLTCRRSCYPPWSPGRLGLWETQRSCFARALNFYSCNSHLLCNTESGLRKWKIFSLKRTLYSLFVMKFFCLTMSFKCFPWKPQTHLILLMQSTCQVTSEPDASPVSHCQDWCYFGVQINTLVCVTTTVSFLNSKYKL